MTKRNHSRKHVSLASLTTLVLIAVLFICLSASTANAVTNDKHDNPSWTIYYRPAVRFGSDDRTLYINDFLIPIYQDDKNILFNNTKFTPNDQDGWEVNVGLGYRRLLLDDRLILGVNGFYDQRKTPWGTIYEQWGMGAEVMADVPIGSLNLGLTGRFNYYWPLTAADIQITPNYDARYEFKGHGIYALDPLVDAYVEEPVGGFDAEMGMRIPYVSDFVETWVYGGGYRFEGKYTEPIDGVSARFEVIPTDFLRFNYEFRSDRTATEQHYGEVSVEVPFSIDNLIAGKNPFEGLGKRLGGSREMKERLVEPVRRDVDVRLCEYTGADAIAVLVERGMLSEEDVLPEDKPVEQLIFVAEAPPYNPSDPPYTPLGTYEAPYYSIGEAFANIGTIKLIHVMDSTTDSCVLGGDANVEGVTVWGAGLLSYRNIVNAYLGYPTIIDTLTISAPNIVVRGLKFDNSSHPALDAPDIGIEIKNGNGVLIEGNIFNIVGTTDKYGIRATIGEIPILTTTPLTITGNSFTVSSSSDAYGIDLSTARVSSIVVDSNSLTVSGDENAYGIRVVNEGRPEILDSKKNIDSNSDRLIAVITSNKIDVDAVDKYGFGIYCAVENSFLDASISSNIINVRKTGDSLEFLGAHPDELVNPLVAYYNDTLSSLNPSFDLIPFPYVNLPKRTSAYGVFIKSDRNLTTTALKELDLVLGVPDILGVLLGESPSAAGVAITELMKLSGMYGYKEYIKGGTIYGFVDHNVIDVTSDKSNAFGVSFLANDTIFGGVSYNLIAANGSSSTGNIFDRNSFGISYASDKVIESYILNNNITSSANEAFGISCEGGEGVYGYVSKYGDDDYDPLLNALAEDFYGDSVHRRILLNSTVVNSTEYSTGINIGAPVVDFMIKDMRNLSVNSSEGAIGISIDGPSDDIPGARSILTEITGNRKADDGYGINVSGGTGAFGILLKGSVKIGSIENPVKIRDNTLKVNSALGTAFGIAGIGPALELGDSDPVIMSEDAYFYADISNNRFPAEPGEDDPKPAAISASGLSGAYGVFLSYLHLGSKSEYVTRYLTISKNSISAESSVGNAFGIACRGMGGSPAKTDDMFVDINNNLLEGVTAHNGAYGIELNGHDVDGQVTKNKMRVESSDGSAYGVYASAAGELALVVAGSGDSEDKETPWIDVSGRNSSYGIYFSGKTDSALGSLRWPIEIGGNNIRVASNNSLMQDPVISGIYGLVTGGSLRSEISANVINIDANGNIREHAYGIFLGSEDGDTTAPQLLDSEIYSNEISVLNKTGTPWGIYIISQNAYMLSSLYRNQIRTKSVKEYQYSECGPYWEYGANGILLQSYKYIYGQPNNVPAASEGINDSINHFLDRYFADRNIDMIRGFLGADCTLYTSIKENLITGESQYGQYGIEAISSNTILADISYNDRISETGGTNDAVKGIELSADKKIMLFLTGLKNVEVSGMNSSYGVSAHADSDLYAYIEGAEDISLSNTVEVKSVLESYGVELGAGGKLSGKIEGVSVSTESTGRSHEEIRVAGIGSMSSSEDLTYGAHGISVSGSWLGTDTDDTFKISNNTITASAPGIVEGLYLGSGYDGFANIGGNTISAASESWTSRGMWINSYQGDVTVNITDNDISGGIGSGDVGWGMASGIILSSDLSLGGDVIGNITGNKINIETATSDALGVFFMSDSGNSVVCDNPDTTVTTGTGKGFDTIDAMVVDSLAELNYEITDGTTGWIYLKAGDYSGTINPIERDLSLWGEHHQMFGVGSANWSALDSPLSFSGTTARALGLSIDTEGPYGISVLDGTKCDFIGNQITVNNPVGDTYAISVHSGGNIGSATRPALMLDNTLSVTADDGNAFGLALEGVGNINTIIENSIISVTASGTDKDGWGILLSGNDMGSTGKPVSILNNTIGVTAGDGNAFGMSVDANGNFTTTIENSILDVTASGTDKDAWGILLLGEDRISPDGSSMYTDLVDISDNTLKVVSEGGGAAGIYGAFTNGIVAADIVNNDMTGGGYNNIGVEGAKSAVGIYLNSHDYSGTISDNKLKTLSTEGTANGISVSSDDSIMADILRNELGETGGLGDTYGMRLVTYAGNIDANISENYFEFVTGLEGSIFGLSVESGKDLLADISWNTIQCAAPYIPTGPDVWVAGKNIYLFNLSANGDIGSIDRPLNIYEDYVGGTNLSFAPWAHVWDQCLADGTITEDDLLEHVEGIGLSLTAGESIFADYNSLTGTGGIRNSSFGIGSYGDAKGLYAQSGNDLFLDILNSSIFAENSTERTDTSIYVTGIELVAGNMSSGLGSIGSADNPVTISDSWICAEAYDNDVYEDDAPSTPKSTPSSARAFGVIHKAALDIFSRITNNSIDVGSTGETYGLNLFTGYEEPDGQLGGGVIGTYDSPVIIDQNILNVYAHCVTPMGVPLWIDQYNSSAGGYIDMGVGDPGSGGNEIYRYSFDYYFEIPGPGFIGNYGINNEVLDNASPIPGSYIYP